MLERDRERDREREKQRDRETETERERGYSRAAQSRYTDIAGNMEDT